VELALKQGIADSRGLEEEAAVEFFSSLRREKRLLKDLY
jgi:sulfite reductase alpha subunit-like flavoprotein